MYNFAQYFLPKECLAMDFLVHRYEIISLCIRHPRAMIHRFVNWINHFASIQVRYPITNSTWRCYHEYLCLVDLATSQYRHGSIECHLFAYGCFVHYEKVNVRYTTSTVWIICTPKYAITFYLPFFV